MTNGKNIGGKDIGGNDNRGNDNGGEITVAGEQVKLRKRLDQLRSEHRDMDDVIGRLEGAPIVDRLQVQRLKKRKLRLKDEINRIEGLGVPDIIA